MTEKIKVSSDVAKSIEHAKNFLTLNEVLENHYDIKSDSFGIKKWIKEYRFLNELTTEELAVALLVGYEVKHTPEETIEIVYDYYKGISSDISQPNNRSKRQQFSAFCDGIDFTLNELNKKDVSVSQSNLFETIKQAAINSSSTTNLIEEEMEAHGEVLKALGEK